MVLTALLLLAPLQGAQEEPASAKCLARLSSGQQIAAISPGEHALVIEHSCACWSAPPKRLLDVEVIPDRSPEAPGVEAAPDLRLVRDGALQVWEHVQPGDRLGSNTTVVAVGMDLVLMDVAGTLAFASNNAANPEFRMVWHSSFSVPAQAGGSTPSSAGSAPGAAARKPPTPAAQHKPAPKKMKQN